MEKPISSHEVADLRAQFDALVEEVRDEILAYATHLSRSREMGHDLFMDAWWEVLERFPTIRRKEPIPFKVYFQRVIKSRYIDYQKSRAKERSIDENVEYSFPEGLIARATVESDKSTGPLFDALAQLDPTLRQVIILQSEGLDSKGAADIIGIDVDRYGDFLEQARSILQAKLLEPHVPQPLAENPEKYLTVYEIAEILDKPWTWVVRHTVLYKEQAREVHANNRVNSLHFPESLLPQLFAEYDTDTPAGEWLTATKMAHELGVGYKWVHKRLFQLPYTGEFRKDRRGQSRLHYPPAALDELVQERLSTEPPDLERKCTIYEFATSLGRHFDWVSRHIADLGVEPEFHRDVVGKVVPFYPRNIYSDLEYENTKYSEQGDRVTMPFLVEAVGKDREWILKKLGELGVRSELRESPAFHRRVYPTYPSEVVDYLQNLREAYIPAEEDELTLEGLVARTGKSRNWIAKRLDKIPHTTRMRQDAKGALRTHYSPDLLGSLLRLKQEQIDKRNAKKWYE
jgi:RNA polymerase sigma factor (sigma-70 family)